MNKINIAIDGPSGAGKSTISDLLAIKLDYIHLDTGAMYRSVAWLSVHFGEDNFVEKTSLIDFILEENGKKILRTVGR